MTTIDKIKSARNISYKMTTTLKEIDEITGGNIVPEFYYEWGDEPNGYVSTGCYLDDQFHGTGVILKSEAIEAGLKFHNPYN